MHIILGILSAVGFLAYLLYRANQAAEVGQALGDAASDGRSWVRRFFWRRKSAVDPVRAIDDPRLAASVMMHVIAKCEGDLSETEKTVILTQMRDVLELTEAQAKEMQAQARWLTADVKDETTFLRRASSAIHSRCDDREKRQLIDMLRAVAEIDDGASELQADAIDRLQHDLGLSHG
jgi:uncharacterized tellurite resistance protein B-like protein